MSYDIIPTVCVAVVFVFAIQGITIYSVTRLLVTGKPMFEKRSEHERNARIVGLER